MKVLTRKGKLFDYAWKGIAFDGNLFIGLKNTTVQEAVRVFTDPDETRELTFYKDENMEDEASKEVVTGYTRFAAVRIDPTADTINVGLGKEYA